MLVVVTRCTTLWENAHVNCKYCEIVSAITMETRSFIIAISDGNQEGNLRGWRSHEVKLHARPTHSSVLPLDGSMTQLRVYVRVDSLVLGRGRLDAYREHLRTILMTVRNHGKKKPHGFSTCTSSANFSTSFVAWSYGEKRQELCAGCHRPEGDTGE